jgi:superfamily II DNA or RNA helicase
MTREEIQKKAVKAIKSNSYMGILDISPRVGKTKILIDSIRDRKGDKIAIVAPYQSIIDTWRLELIKWNLDFEVTLLCTRSVNKLPDNLNLLVIDEIQTLSERQISTINKKTGNSDILGLTGTLSEVTEDKLLIELGVEPIFTYSIDNAIKDGIISNFEIVLVECKLDNSRKIIKSGPKRRSIMRTEREHYEYLTKQYEKFKKLSWDDKSFEYLKDYYINQRRDFIYTSQSKVNVAKKIISRGTRSLVFTGRIPQAEYLTKHSYHSKNRKDDNLRKFIEGEIDQVSVINMVNMGITIPDLKCAVIHQLQSNSEMSLQKILRICNLEEDKVAKIYITVYKNTVDEEWTKKALMGVDSTRIRIVDEGKV